MVIPLSIEYLTAKSFALFLLPSTFLTPVATVNPAIEPLTANSDESLELPYITSMPPALYVAANEDASDLGKLMHQL